jgi:bacillithiol biosynthesis cysteine-adding enzyme BshC
MNDLDLLKHDRLPAFPAAFMQGGDLDLLRPLRFVADGVDLKGLIATPVDRTGVARALGPANDGYGHPRATELADRLESPTTRVVVTGQQPGLFGGPLYTLSKAVAAVKWADRLERESGEPAVALFWMATEDHDFAEVARATFLGPDAPLTVDLGEDPAALMPVGMRSLGKGVEAALQTLREIFPGDRSEAWFDTLAQWYRPDARFGEAFARLLVRLLGERAPLIVDSMLPELKRAQSPYLRELVERRAAVADALAERESMITDRGYDLQVAPQPDAAPLFLLRDGERRRVEWVEDGFRLRGVDAVEPLATLLETIDDNPGAVSPGVQSRPLLQDAVFGTTLQILGPGELSYMPQVAPLYELLEVKPPQAALRPQMLVADSRQETWRGELGVGWDALTAIEFDGDRLLADRAGGDPVAPVAAEVDRLLDQLEGPLTELDPNLKHPLGKTRDHVARGLETLSGKARAAMARRNEIEARRLESLRQLCRPNGTPQERILSTAHFPAKYGDDFVRAVEAQLELDPAELHLIVLD